MTIMKKLTMALMALTLGAMPFLFAGCDDTDDWDYYNPWDDGFSWDNPWWYNYGDGGYNWNDNYDHDRNDNNDDYILAEAQALNGEWRGKMQYASGEDKQTYEFDCDMTFTQYNRNAVNGTGYETDTSGDQTQTLQFNWYVDESNGNINIKYKSTDGKSKDKTFVMDAQANQRGFSLKEGDYFDGYMIGTNTDDMAYIELDRVTDGTRAAAGQNRLFGSKNLLKPKMNAPQRLLKR